MSSSGEMFLISLDLHLTRNCWSWRFNTKKHFLHCTFLNILQTSSTINNLTTTIPGPLWWQLIYLLYKPNYSTREWLMCELYKTNFATPTAKVACIDKINQKYWCRGKNILSIPDNSRAAQSNIHYFTDTIQRKGPASALLTSPKVVYLHCCFILKYY